MSTQQVQANPLMTMKFVWFALAASQVMLLVLSFSTQKPVSPDGTDVTPDVMINYVLAATAMGSAFLAFMLPKILATPVKKQLASTGRPLETIDAQELAPKVMVPFIIRWALLDSVTVMGFVSSFTSGDPKWVVGSAMVALVGFALSFPNERTIRSLLV